MKTTERALVGVIALLAAAGCAGPAERIEAMAGEFGFVREVVKGDPFDHLVYRNSHAGRGATLHVYIEGDGRPYVDRRTISRDPTPDNPVMLELMAIDDGPSVYLGRPCYFGLHTAPECRPVHWTIGRFGEEVVSSMASALESIRNETGARSLVLIGHSGGGAIAVLLARRMAGVDALVTIAGNLDTAAWTALHGYAPLSLSLNPAAAPLISVPFVLHLVGARDTVTPPEFVRRAARRLGSSVQVVEQAGHACCWRALWPSVLERLP